jgi:hypothetical protein
VSGRLETVADDQEAPPGFEPGMKVLQTSALPLGYGARKQTARHKNSWHGSLPACAAGKSTLTSPCSRGKVS